MGPTSLNRLLCNIRASALPSANASSETSYSARLHNCARWVNSVQLWHVTVFKAFRGYATITTAFHAWLKGVDLGFVHAFRLLLRTGMSVSS